MLFEVEEIIRVLKKDGTDTNVDLWQLREVVRSLQVSVVEAAVVTGCNFDTASDGRAKLDAGQASRNSAARGFLLCRTRRRCR